MNRESLGRDRLHQPNRPAFASDGTQIGLVNPRGGDTKATTSPRRLLAGQPSGRHQASPGTAGTVIPDILIRSQFVDARPVLPCLSGASASLRTKRPGVTP